jgi:type IV pilus assembly protein PilA
MIVVVIVGILSALAVVGYRRLLTASHVSEATEMVQAIRVAQESYQSDTLQYANISNTITSYYPQTAPVGNLTTAWGAKCSVCTSNMDWSMLPLHVDGPVLFGYATVAGAPGATPPSFNLTPSQLVTFTAATTNWYVISATCDLDGLGAPNTNVLASSFSSQISMGNEGQ